MKAIKKMINSACQWDVQARKRMDCGAAWTIGLVEAALQEAVWAVVSRRWLITANEAGGNRVPQTTPERF